MSWHAPNIAAALLTLGVVCASGAQTPESGLIATKGGDTLLVRQLSTARIQGDADEMIAALDELARRFPTVCACVAQRLLDEDPWPHAGFEENEAFRTYLTTHLADLGVAPADDCFLQWSHHVSIELPEGLSDPMQMTEMDLADKRDLLMQIALYFPYERSLFDRLIHLAGTETQPDAQELALMAAARLLARAPGKVDQEAGALMTLLHARAEQPSTRDKAADIAGVVVAAVPSVNLFQLTQYLGGEPGEKKWALDVWRHTDFRRLDEARVTRLVDILLLSNADGESDWAEAAVLAHIDSLTALVQPRLWSLLGSPLEDERTRAVQWAAATHITPEDFLPLVAQLYAVDSPAVRIVCVEGIAELVGRTESYEEMVPLLPTLVEDLHDEDPRLSRGAANLLRKLLAVHCSQPDRFTGLDGALTALTAELDGDDVQRRGRVLRLLARVRSDCLPPQVRKQLER